MTNLNCIKKCITYSVELLLVLKVTFINTVILHREYLENAFKSSPSCKEQMSFQFHGIILFKIYEFE